MTHITTRQFILPILLAGGVLLSPLGAVAQYPIERLEGEGQSQDFVVGPGKVELSIPPGESRTVNITVANRLGSEKTFSLGTEDFKGSEDPAETVVLLGDERGPYSLRDFLSFASSTVTLGHLERATIPVTVSIPADAEAGGRYGSVLVSVASEGTDAATASAVVSRIGVLFFVEVPGDITREGRLAEFETAGEHSLFSEGPILFRLLYENTGSVHLNPYGEIRIENLFGEEVGMLTIDPWFAMPQSLRLREVLWDRGFLFGRYTATAYVNRGYDNVIDEASVTFYVIPWKLSLGILAGFVLVIFVIRLFFRNVEIRRKQTPPSKP